jgi:death-on-curing protein
MEFLTVADVTRLHQLQQAKFGGAAGVRDMGLLESAVSQAQATFDGEYLHQGLFAMAAAYLFHLVKNHPFMDGNKRVGLLAALVFMDLNGCEMLTGSEELFELTLGVAEGRLGKDEVTRGLAKAFESTR